MPIYDLICSNCHEEINDAIFLSRPDKIMHLRADDLVLCGEFELLWRDAATRHAAVCERERAVVWYHPKHGVRYPGRNDVSMPPAYQKAGFERRELPSLKDIQRLEKERGVVSEINHFDRGSGRDFFSNQ